MTDAAYLAGLFDGEGCVSIYGNGLRTGYSLCVQLTQNDGPVAQRILSELAARFGGAVSRQVSGSGATKLNWQARSASAELFLMTVMPFLQLKRLQARLALAWERQRPALRRDVRGRITAKPADVRRFDCACYVLLRRLKKKPASDLLLDEGEPHEVKNALRLLLSGADVDKSEPDEALA